MATKSVVVEAVVERAIDPVVESVLGPVAAPAALPPAVISEKVVLVAVEPIRLDGKDLAPGRTFLADVDTAADLLAAGAAVVGDVEAR